MEIVQHTRYIKRFVILYAYFTEVAAVEVEATTAVVPPKGDVESHRPEVTDLAVAQDQNPAQGRGQAQDPGRDQNPVQGQGRGQNPGPSLAQDPGQPHVQSPGQDPGRNLAHAPNLARGLRPDPSPGTSIHCHM